MASSSPNRESAPTNKLKVFLSYSRKDSAFAQELLAALELLGFDAYLDKEDIAPGEPWEERLSNLIRLADTVVFVISPNSLTSERCTWEVDETARAGKRLVPVILVQVPDNAVPERLRKLNYVYFVDGQSFSKALGELTRALRADAGWIREHTRYGELAIRWIEREKPAALLLRGSDIDDAKRWQAERPADAPEISANQQAYIEASSKTADEELAAKAKLRWRVQAGLAFASVVLAALAGFSILLWQTAETAKGSLAESNAKLERTVGELRVATDSLVTQNALLDATNARLERKLALRAAPRGYMPYDVPAGWFQVATSYAGAVAFVEKRTNPNRLTASGVLVNARLLNPSWDEKPVFVTATYVVAKDGSFYAYALPPAEAQIVMLGPKNERRTASLRAILWQSENLGVSISSIEGALPVDVTVIKTANAKPAALSDLKVLSPAEIDALFDDKAMLKYQKEPRPIVFMGNLQGRSEVAISVSHLLGALGASRPGALKAPGAVGRSRGIDPVPVRDKVQPDLLYTHGTLPGGGGSPIFDAETGDLIGIHLIAYPCAQSVPTERHCAAAGTSFPRLLAAIRAE
jgi:hypothetical protein